MLLFAALSCRPGDLPEQSGPIPPPDTRQSFLLVVSDTTRADHMGFLGQPLPLTPALDRLASSCVRFHAAHAHAPWTKPSIASLMTSQLPSEHGLTSWFDVIPAGTPTLSTELSSAGWQTSAVVANRALDPEGNTFHVGFDRYDSSVYGEEQPEQLITSETLTDIALAELSALESDGRPFFLWVQYFDPHIRYFSHDTPLSLGDALQDDYAEEIAYTDQEIGRLLSAVEGREDITVVFLADHGEEIYDHGELGHGQSLYQELIHVPLLVCAPGQPPRDISAPVGLEDVAPTLLSLAGLPPQPRFGGRPLLPEPEERPVLSMEDMHDRLRSVIWGGYKLVVRSDRAELFDLEADPLEQVDLSGQGKPEEVLLFDIALARWPEIGGW